MSGWPGPPGTAIDQRRDHDLEAALCEPSCELLLGGDAGSESADLLRRLIGIGKGHDMTLAPAHRFQQQTFAEYVLQNRPAHLVHPVEIGFGHQRRVAVVAEPFHPNRHPLVHHSEDLAQPSPISFHRFLVRGARREIPLPKLLARLHRFGDLALDECVSSIHHALRKIALPGQQLRPGERIPSRRRISLAAAFRGERRTHAVQQFPSRHATHSVTTAVPAVARCAAWS